MCLQTLRKTLYDSLYFHDSTHWQQTPAWNSLAYSYLVLKGYLQQQDPYECHQSKMVPTHLLYLEYQI